MTISNPDPTTQQIADDARQQCNTLTREERDAAFQAGMDIIAASLSSPEYHLALNIANLMACGGAGLAASKAAEWIVQYGDGREAGLQARLTQYSADVMRLEAIERNKWGVWWNDRADAFIVQERGQVVGNVGRGKTVREAVDAAINTQR